MKDTVQKLELMMKCYKGKWHPINGDREQVNPYGFGGAYMSLGGDAQNVVDDICPARAIDRMRIRYQHVVQAYEGIPFDQLDESDEAFSTIFATRDLIPQLGSCIEYFISNPTAEGVSHIQEVIDRMVATDNPTFRSRIQKLHKLLYGTPTPSE